MTQHKPSILIIDDNPRITEDYTLFFRDNNFIVHTAKNGPDGIEHAKRELPSVILLDLMLPEMNGLETLTALKDNGSTKDIPIIVITALVEDQQKRESMKAGAFDYVAKVDITPDELLKKVRHALSQAD